MSDTEKTYIATVEEVIGKTGKHCQIHPKPSEVPIIPSFLTQKYIFTQVGYSWISLKKGPIMGSQVQLLIINQSIENVLVQQTNSVENQMFLEG